MLFAGLVQTTYTVGKYLNDVETSWGTIWVFGLGLSILASVCRWARTRVTTGRA